MSVITFAPMAVSTPVVVADTTVVAGKTTGADTTVVADTIVVAVVVAFIPVASMLVVAFAIAVIKIGVAFTLMERMIKVRSDLTDQVGSRRISSTKAFLSHQP